MRIRSLATPWLQIDDWELAPDEIWCVLGGNASGKSLLAAIIVGERQAPGVILENAPRQVSWLSFESAQRRYERELAEDETDFMDRLDTGSTGLELLLESGCSETEARAAAKRFGIDHRLDLGCRCFSSGELRRFDVLRETLAEPDLLILDDPFEGLDSSSLDAVSEFLGQLAQSGMRLLLLVNRIADVTDWSTHLAVLRRGEIIAAGPRQELLRSAACQQLLALDASQPPEVPPPPRRLTPPADPLVSLRNGAVKYGDTYQFKQFDWTLRPGEHTLIMGPNGCGKSTLLNLIVGDHPQCYANDLQVFGYHRGSGESIWDIKRNIGIISPAFHRDYRVGGSVVSAVVSGFFDSIGLYQQPTRVQQDAALAWLAVFGLADQAHAPIKTLSYGQQRLALIARALVKQPPLLVLDEPTQGLDDLNRHLLLACLQRLSQLSATTLLFVSHRQDERLDLFAHHLHFVASAHPDTRYTIVANRPVFEPANTGK